MKHKLMTIVFCAILLAGFVLNVITPDKEISFTERRPLDQMPELNKEFIFSKNTGEVLEEYLLDQFWNRDGVRSLKVWVDRNILRKTDVNGLYQIGEHLFKMDYPISENSVIKAGEKMLAIQEKFFGDTNQVAFSMIPDKAHYAPNKDKYLSLDYKKMMQLLEDTLTEVKDGGATRIPTMGCIDLESTLELDDYYYTDLHWKQENLKETVEAIWAHFGIEAELDMDEFTVNDYAPFYGAYYGQAASNGNGDQLSWLVDEEIENMIVKDFDEMKASKDIIYAEEKLGTVDSYELFFGGNSPLIVIDNPACETGDRLILFRDSFGSAIAPLLAKEYSQVVLVDLRFLGYEFLGNFVDFEGADVLFMWGQAIYNDSTMIRQR